MLDTFSNEEKQSLIEYAKKSILAFFKSGKYPNYELVCPKRLCEKGNTYIELFINGTIRGSMGNFNGDYSLINSVSRNSIGAAFEDPRSPKLTILEFHKLKIAVSILSPLTEISVSSSNDLINKFPKGLGIVLVSDKGRSVMMPHMWDNHKTHESFLGELCLKAGFAKDSWINVKDKKFMIFESIFIKE